MFQACAFGDAQDFASSEYLKDTLVKGQALTFLNCFELVLLVKSKPLPFRECLSHALVTKASFSRSRVLLPCIGGQYARRATSILM